MIHLLQDMKKAIWTGGFPPEVPIERRLALASEAGFDGVELVVDETLVGSDAQLRGLAELAGRTVPIHSLMCAFSRRLGSPDPAERPAAVDAVQRAIRAARLLGADTILVIPAVVSDRVTYEQAWALGQSGLRALIPTAERYGVCLAVENIWNKFLLSPLEMRRFIDEVGHPLVQAYFDVGNVLAFGYPEQWIDVLGRRIRRVHLKDFKTRVGDIDGFVQLLEGDVDWPAVMAALRRVGYDSYLTSEVAPYRHADRESAFAVSRAIDAIMAL
ncbi:MAG TPA: sugar phosphate isomerase/epimerase family protein [Chloroflexota bacterium]|nr:sugar phosphate isomerase/epimerase family protein [Chloroflexota bacterium]